MRLVRHTLGVGKRRRCSRSAVTPPTSSKAARVDSWARTSTAVLLADQPPTMTAAAISVSVDSTLIRSREAGERHLEVRGGNIETPSGGRQVFAAVANLSAFETFPGPAGDLVRVAMPGLSAVFQRPVTRHVTKVWTVPAGTAI